MKTFGNFEFDIDEREDLFIELLHVNELSIKFDFIDNDNYLFFFYNKEFLFNYRHKDSYVVININISIYNTFNSNFLCDMVDKYIIPKYPLKSYIIDREYKNIINTINRLFYI